MKTGNIVKKASHFTEYVLLLASGVVFRSIPVSWTSLFVNILGFFAFHVFRIRRDVTLDNLRNALGDEVSERELHTIARKSYVNIGSTFIEFICAPKLAPRILKIVDLSDIEVMRKIIDRGKGLIIVSGHFGNWELNGGAIAAIGFPVTVVVKNQSNKFVDRLVNNYRSLLGITVISTKESMKHLVRALRRCEPIGLMSDQDTGKRGVFVDFFGRKASTPRGAAQLALKYGTPIVVTMTVRLRHGRFKSLFSEVEILPDDTVESLTQRFTGVMEDIIRRYPEQYFWMHRRWKTRCEL